MMTPPDIPTIPVRLARPAMATRFEWVLWGQTPERLRAAGEEALDEVDALEAALSRYRGTSDIGRVNAGAAAGPVRVSPNTFGLLERARWLTDATDGAFDITVGALLRAWGFVGDTGRKPSAETVRRARDAAGWNRVRLDASAFSVTFDHPDVELDLGAIGKGYALDRAMDLLTEAGVPHALLHGGTSSILARGLAPDGGPWRVGLPAAATPGDGPASPPVSPVSLQEMSLSVSAVWGKSFTEDGNEFGHVLDPRFGEPVRRARCAAVVGAEAALSDALSTALLVLGPEGRPLIESNLPGYRCIHLEGQPGSAA
ncbi:MAG: FAD:protein FMN transferase [Verrucomicrobium sp.]|jgi:thiamine biosynthesis lipoprotein|nr:FAD:protein FMN transferase [Verrucomicrobium sp.]